MYSVHWRACVHSGTRRGAVRDGCLVPCACGTELYKEFDAESSSDDDESESDADPVAEEVVEEKKVAPPKPQGRFVCSLCPTKVLFGEKQLEAHLASKVRPPA